MKKIILSCCLISSLSLSAYAQNKHSTVGIWYDDLGSPQYGDSTLVIEKEGEKYFVLRRNGDGSGSRYRLKRIGSEYSKVGDRFGAKYVITAKGLEIHDKAGYIRTAKPKRP
ncbi:hypothetical protein [Fluviicoccus keumensis]|uniref:hypothetical protein n=1 Tax=Fluviicoccus keumensis TaxID=1435465 RepID=UPI00102D0636|nr:hypothetical protein [Fluviicoccus keumensis]